MAKGEELKLYGEKLEVRIRELEEKIYEEATEKNFNINSPKQLGVILFEKMKMPGRLERRQKARIFHSSRMFWTNLHRTIRLLPIFWNTGS